MSEWAGLGYDGMPIVRGYHRAVEVIPKWYSRQLAPTLSMRRSQREKLALRKSEMELLWEDIDEG